MNKDDIKLPALHYDELPEPDDTIPAMHNYARRAIKADRQRRGEPVAWHTEDHLTDKSATTYDPIVAERWPDKGWSVTPLFNASQPTEPVKPVKPTSDDNTLTIAYMCGYNDAIRSTIPEGWQLVPIEPTDEMTQAGVNLALSAMISGAYPWPTYIRDMYKTMLSAAPKFGEE